MTALGVDLGLSAPAAPDLRFREHQEQVSAADLDGLPEVEVA